MNPEAQSGLDEAVEAREAGDWDGALTILRRWSRYIEPSLLSFLRGSVWMEAGDAATADLFFRHAAQLKPDNGVYEPSTDRLLRPDPQR